MSPALGPCPGAQHHLPAWDAGHGDAMGRVARGHRGSGGDMGSWVARGVRGDTAPRAGDKRGACLLPPLPRSFPATRHKSLGSAGADTSRERETRQRWHVSPMHRGRGGGVHTPALGSLQPPVSFPPPGKITPALRRSCFTPRGCSVSWRPRVHPWRTSRAWGHQGWGCPHPSHPPGWRRRLGMGAARPCGSFISIQCRSMGYNSTFTAGY